MKKTALTPLVLIAAVMVTVKATDLSECLAAAGVDVTTNLIERSFENYTEYIDINFQWQLRGETRLPRFYLKVNSAADVQSAVKCGRSLGLAVVARSGGHGYLKYAYGQNDDITIVLDLQNLRSISVDQQARTATVDAGARAGHVVYQLYENGNFMIPFGGCGSVGISGLTLGGGHTLLAPLYGLVSDNVLEMEMVNADGQLLTINNRTNEDLFWALRGAGVTGSFGIVTKFVFQIYEAPHSFFTGSVVYSMERFHEFFQAFQAYFTRTHDKPLYYQFQINVTHVRGTFTDIQNSTEVEVVGANRVEEAMDSFPSPDGLVAVSSRTYREHLINNVRPIRTYGFIQSNFTITEPSDLMKINSYGFGSEWFKAKSFFVKKLLNTSEILVLQQLFTDVNFPGMRINGETFAGKVQDPQYDSAFIHRDAYFYVFLYIYRETEDEPLVSAKLSEFFEKSKELLNHTTSYQNYPDDEMDDFLERYYGENLPRLIDIKTEVDPDDFFNTNPQSIPVRSSGSRVNDTGMRTTLTLICLLMLYIIPLSRRKEL